MCASPAPERANKAVQTLLHGPGWLYMATIDLFNREVIGYAMAEIFRLIGCSSLAAVESSLGV
ncbi:hypothetical protein Vse01_36100 [Micromonospora sediminimaris]|uniref:Uncharacterized protein n=1 Tax=Micromonospora sediminimaris TaxID=547162 RepID=A0A9W5URX8_9ACTN|nr:hypothetical protein Vse01_36100 [Micromonospora sediminimaris]